MKLNDRQKEIVDVLGNTGELSVELLAERFSVSTQTIRKDINQLCEAGLTRRVHGGVALPVTTQNSSYHTRRTTNASVKSTIAQACATHIPSGSSLFLGIGTSVAMLAEALIDHRDLQVLTNNLDVANILCDHVDINVLLSGGRLRCNDRDLVGEKTVQFFREFRVDFGIVGSGGLDPDAGLLDFDPQEAEVSRAILANSRQRILLADASKWKRRAMVVVAPFEQIDLFITDRLTSDQQGLLDSRGLEWLATSMDDVQ
ncbi:Glycerol-3-phosphate regulon repressor, DeoR family [Marinobacterium lacunae]|uniref:Glycerol-3-phosphate regulon repressor, DeoR family n=1 Tax=Marinobacterium lacunae TaxID=1232683 RepID=A0A081G1T5_9GAMM|nr:DeoR/GlpR family DNA-binding transcription regulator [Marinobacterium lacunae]KEA64740.1 Glycerol-3-phosphate regulon repressor, DeoR family [Marinobacterium lacunae]MBR9882699.1 DeoR/GlpR transcriptional regulator [Oceanospirillales bacterium]